MWKFDLNLIPDNPLNCFLLQWRKRTITLQFGIEGRKLHTGDSYEFIPKLSFLQCIKRIVPFPKTYFFSFFSYYHVIMFFMIIFIMQI